MTGQAWVQRFVRTRPVEPNVVATMLVHGVEVLVTSNVADFSRFADQVQVIDLPDTPRLT